MVERVELGEDVAGPGNARTTTPTEASLDFNVQSGLTWREEACRALAGTCSLVKRPMSATKFDLRF